MAPELVETIEQETVDETVGAGGVGAVGGGGGGAGLPLPLEVLERNLTSYAAHVAAAEARWLGWLGEYCERQGWGEWGCSGPAQWLQWRCGMSPSTARDKVRVAVALRGLPTVFQAFAAGRLSYSKVRAVTRVATGDNEAHLAELAVHATGSQLDRIVRGYRNVVQARKPVVSAWQRRRCTVRRDDQAGVATFTIVMPLDDGVGFDNEIEAEVTRIIDDALAGDTDRTSRAEVIAARGGPAAIRADAVVALVTGTTTRTGTEPADITIVVDADDHPDHLDGHDGGASAEARPVGLAAAVVTHDGRRVATPVGERLCCDPRIAALVEDSRGTVLGVSQTTRLIGRKLRRALERRDRGCCQFPGCAASRRLHAHHIVHWANGGPTELDNLILLCTFHHHVVHEGGWNIDRHDRTFIKPDGTRVDPTPTARSRGSATTIAQIGHFTQPAPLAEATYEPFDLGLTLETLFDD